MRGGPREQKRFSDGADGGLRRIYWRNFQDGNKPFALIFLSLAVVPCVANFSFRVSGERKNLNVSDPNCLSPDSFITRQKPVQARARSRSRANPFNPALPVLNWSKGHLSFNGINPSACVPVFRVSDEGGFGRARPLGRAQPVSRVSGKTDRSRGSDKIANSDKTITDKGRIQISTPPHVGKGVGIP